MYGYPCTRCVGKYNWYWQEAFLKTGTCASDQNICCVEEVLNNAGYDVKIVRSKRYVIIRSITKEGGEQIPSTAKVGYDNPEQYLPQAIVDMLGRTFLTEYPFVFKGG